MNINLRKEKVQIILEKKKLVGVKANVVLVLDKSGSMYSLYSNGIVQDVIERIWGMATIPVKS